MARWRTSHIVVVALGAIILLFQLVVQHVVGVVAASGVFIIAVVTVTALLLWLMLWAMLLLVWW